MRLCRNHVATGAWFTRFTGEAKDGAVDELERKLTKTGVHIDAAPASVNDQ